ncbi:glycosyl transferase [Haloarcula sp. S1CR25-12]|uniref:Glycosyl transferase n=1 Tax=Haloarcula saliterrae TaxID=2950534 RepID=A0ABU2F9R0_9EURY|nr:glycosyl transferase [Haloarcula sp. S1CR25-12]MDS0258956.1 glycosyl transferase [Haloarcula sp. S1CR25-12]
MAIGGTRLDNPSAVGDEGRPRGASLTVVAVIVVGVLAAAGFLVGQPLLFSSFGLLVGLASAGLALLCRDRLGPVVLGHLLFLPSAVVLAALVAVSGLVAFARPGLVFLVVGGLAAMFGVAAGWNDAFDRETVQTALGSSVISYVFWLVAVVVVGIAVALGIAGRQVVLSLTRGTGPVAGLFGLLALLGVAGGCLYLAVRAIPAVQLTPVHRRPAARARYMRLRSTLVYVTAGAWGLAAVAVAGLVAGVLQTVLAIPPISGLVAVVAALTAIPLACVAVLSVLIAAVAWVARRATSGFDSLSTGTVGAAVAALCYVFALLVLVPTLARFGAVGLTFFFAIPVLPVLVYAILVIVLVGFYTGAIPGRAGSVAVAAAGLIAVGLGAALVGFPSLFVFGAVAGGLVVWDVGTFGLGVTAELGHIPETRRLELYHGVIAVGIALLGIAALSALDIARRSVGPAVGTPATMGVAVLGVVLVALALRG